MERPGKICDRTKKNMNARGNSDSEKWKRQALYNVPTDKPHPESTSAAAQERTSGSRDRPPYRDGRLQLAQQRQQAYQKTRDLSDRLRSMNLRSGSDAQHKLNAGNSTTSELGEPKGMSGEQSRSEFRNSLKKNKNMSSIKNIMKEWGNWLTNQPSKPSSVKRSTESNEKRIGLRRYSPQSRRKKRAAQEGEKGRFSI